MPSSNDLPRFLATGRGRLRDDGRLPRCFQCPAPDKHQLLLSSQPFQQFPSSTFWRQLVIRQEEFYWPLVLSKLLFVEKKEKFIFSPVLHTVDQTFAERLESSMWIFVDNSQPDGHLQFDHDPTSQQVPITNSASRSFCVQGCDLKFVISYVPQFTCIRPAWQPCTKLRYQYHDGCMCDVTAL